MAARVARAAGPECPRALEVNASQDRVVGWKIERPEQGPFGVARYVSQRLVRNLATRYT